MPELDESSVVSSGTTTVGLTTSEGVVLAADRRASLGGRFVSNKNAIKIEEVHPRAAVTMSGSVGGAQAFFRQLRAEASLYENRRGTQMSIDALAQLAGQLLRGMPASPVLGGVESDGTPRVFSVDGAGGVLEDEYTASGSGTMVATGTLERLYDHDHSMEEAVGVAVEAVASASERDTASGNGVTIARITTEGIEVETYEDISEVL